MSADAPRYWHERRVLRQVKRRPAFSRLRNTMLGAATLAVMSVPFVVVMWVFGQAGIERVLVTMIVGIAVAGFCAWRIMALYRVEEARIRNATPCSPQKVPAMLQGKFGGFFDRAAAEGQADAGGVRRMPSGHVPERARRGR